MLQHSPTFATIVPIVGMYKQNGLSSAASLFSSHLSIHQGLTTRSAILFNVPLATMSVVLGFFSNCLYYCSNQAREVNRRVQGRNRQTRRVSRSKASGLDRHRD